MTGSRRKARWLSLWIALPVAAQQSTQLSGLIRDPSDAAIPGAAVTLTSEETGFRRNAQSNDDGGYTIASLQPGLYKITVRKEGFRTAIRFGVKLDVALPARVDFTLPIGSAYETITVESPALEIQSDNASVGTLVTREWIGRLPLNGRGLLSLLELTPGTVVTPATRGEAGQFTVNGQRPNTHYFTVDGVSVNSGVMAGAQPAQTTGGSLPGMTAFGSYHNLVPLEALEEFRVQTSTLVPEFGRLPGANITLNSRSGSNVFHGSLFEYLRNERLDANDWFANRYRLPRSPQRLHDFGASVSGPLLRNRTFFFGSYEQLRFRQPFTWRAPVPSLETRAAAPDWVRPLLTLYPEPTGALLSNGTGEWLGQSNRPSRVDVGSLRLDQSIRSRLHLFGRFNQAPSWNEFGSSQVNHLSIRSRALTGGITATFAPWLLSEFRAGHSRSRAASTWSQTRAAVLTPCFWTEIGAQFQPTAGCDTFYRYSIGGLGQIVSGRESNVEQDQWNLVNVVSVVSGSHQIRVGGDWRQLTPARATPVTMLNVMADSLDDLVARRNLWIASTDFPVTRSLLREWSAFAQDTWRVIPRLTLTYGVRWEFAPPVRGLQQQGPFRPPVEQDLWAHQYLNLGSRVGGAVRLRRNGSTVLRTGFGLYFDSSLGIAADIVNGVWSSFWQVGNPLPEASGPGRTLLTQAFVPDLRLPRVWQWNTTVEHAFGQHGVASLGYIGAQGLDLVRREVGGPEFVNLVRISTATNHGGSDYHGFQAQLRGRIGSRLQTMVSYTWSHAMDTGSSDGGLYWIGSGLSARRDRASADFDVRQVFAAAATYETGEQWGASLKPWLRSWSLNGIWRARTGFPVDVLNAERAMGVGFANVFRPDSVAGIPVWRTDRTAPGGRLLNPQAFATPSEFAQGSLGRNVICGFGMTQVDIAAQRDFRFSERASLQIRLEVFNAFNRANFADPVRYRVSPLFGQSASMLNGMLGTGTPASGLAPSLQSGGPRSAQLTARFRF
jgi:hypothetical protein